MSLHNTFAHNPPIILVLDEYEAANLHWLLSVALNHQASKFTYVKDPNGGVGGQWVATVHPVGLHTGDWTAQVKGQLEGAMQEHEDRTQKPIGHPNVGYPPEEKAWRDLSELERAVRVAVPARKP